MNGTPKSLHCAIVNGIESSTTALHEVSADGLASFVLPHVKDYLAQKFGAVILAGEPDEAAKLIELFKRITEGGDE